jgi:hypothetical protein
MRTALDGILFVTQMAAAVVYFVCSEWIARGTVTWFWSGNLKESDCLGDVIVDARIKVDINDKGWDAIDLIYLVQDRDIWPAVVNTIMKLRVPENTEYCLSS